MYSSHVSFLKESPALVYFSVPHVASNNSTVPTHQHFPAVQDCFVFSLFLVFAQLTRKSHYTKKINRRREIMGAIHLIAEIKDVNILANFQKDSKHDF